MDELKRLREWLENMADVCVDYDGFRDVEGLKRLVDDLRGMANDALAGKPPTETTRS